MNLGGHGFSGFPGEQHLDHASTPTTTSTVARGLGPNIETSQGNVHFLEGFVQDTLPHWPSSTAETPRPIALLRIDVDIYSATYDALHYLYPHLVSGGAVLFDDWKLGYSREAIVNYRTKHNITTPVEFLEGCVDPMAYWIKE